MSIDTEMLGDADSCHAVARWMQNSLAESFESCATTIQQVHRDSVEHWQGPAGEAFRVRINAGRSQTDQLTDDAQRAGRAIADFAHTLEAVERVMSGARASAASAGLTVVGFLIQPPGSPPPDVAPTRGPQSPAEAASRQDALAAIADYNQKVRAYDEAAADASRARDQEKAAVDALVSTLHSQVQHTPFTAFDALLGTGTESSDIGEAIKQGFEDFVGSEFFNIFGRNDSFPLIPLFLAAGKMTRMYRGIQPIFQTGLVGQKVLAIAKAAGGNLASIAQWVDSPAGHLLTRRVGIAGGLVSTGMGAYGLYKQGNPIDAFQRDKAGYVSDVASTAFSASTTAFLVAPNPVTGAIAVGTGVVWAGAEVVDHWDDITEFGGNTWDAASEGLSNAGESVSEAWDDTTDTLSNATDKAGDVVGDLVGGMF
jgi:hypothetical protein